MKKELISILASILFLTNITQGQSIITDRPDQTESSVTVAFKSFQIESGFLFSSYKENGLTIKNNFYPTTLFRYGLTSGIELRLVGQFEKLRQNNADLKGLSDFEIGTKIELLNQTKTNAQIAFLTHLVIPSGSKELRSDRLGIVNKLAFSHSINSKLGIGYNIGYDYYGIGNGDLTYSLAFGLGAGQKIGLFFETYGEYIEFENFNLNFDTGITYLIKDHFQLDFSVGKGLNHQMSFLSFGFSWNISRLI